MNEVASKAQFEAEVAQLSPRLLALRGWEVVSHTFPLLEIVFRAEGKRPTMIRTDFEGWPEVPPSVRIATPERKTLVPPLQGGPGIFNPSQHPATSEPFICMAGVREYHTHPSHVSDHWDRYRTMSGYDLGGIVTRIWSGWRKTP